MEQYCWDCPELNCGARTRSGEAVGYAAVNEPREMTDEEWGLWITHITEFDNAHRKANACGNDKSWAWRP